MLRISFSYDVSRTENRRQSTHDTDTRQTTREPGHGGDAESRRPARSPRSDLRLSGLRLALSRVSPPHATVRLQRESPSCLDRQYDRTTPHRLQSSVDTTTGEERYARTHRWHPSSNLAPSQDVPPSLASVPNPLPTRLVAQPAPLVAARAQTRLVTRCRHSAAGRPSSPPSCRRQRR